MAILEKGVIERLYHDQDWSIEEIAEEYGVSKSTILVFIKENHIRLKRGWKKPTYSHSYLYQRWNNMRLRCKHDKNYADIEICPLWKKSFLAFREWALMNGFRPDLELDRRDNSKGYSPDNCRWTTCRQNNRNKRNNHYIRAFGETKCLQAWTEDPRCCVGRDVIAYRIKDKHWPPEKAIITPSRTWTRRTVVQEVAA